MNTFTCDDLYHKETLGRILRSLDLCLNKNLSQHFLVDKPTLETIVESVGRGKVVLEVGAGLGSLTCLLKHRFERIYAVEIDDRFSDLFNQINSEEHVKFLNRNFLDLDFSNLDLDRTDNPCLVGNIPYQITGKVLEKTIFGRDYFSRAVFTVQKEVADRILSRPGTRGCGPITYFVHAYGEVSPVVDIPPEAFVPPPKVDSSTVKIELLGQKRFTCDQEVFFSLIQGTFIHRRKTIRKSLISSPEFSLSKESVDLLLDRAGIDSRNRPEELTLEDYNRLGRELVEHRK